MRTMKIAEVPLRSWSDIHKFAKPYWVFRGQRAAKQQLSTSFERFCERNRVRPRHRIELEKRLNREFRRAYHLYAHHIPDKDSRIEWLALMQHHGAPTRLLDFTYSIYVAAYFATETADDDSVIWALDARWALRRAAELLRSGGRNEDAVGRMEKGQRFEEGDEKPASDLFLAPPQVTAAWPVNPLCLNERLVIQKGVFMVPGDITKSFMENLQALQSRDEPKKIFRLVIPWRHRETVIRNLFDMGMSRASLFPGLDGFAQSLGKGWHPALDKSGWV